VYAGIDEHNLFGRLDFHEIPEDPVQLIVNLDVDPPRRAGKSEHWRLAVDIHRNVQRWELRDTEGDRLVIESQKQQEGDICVALTRTFEFKIPYADLRAEKGSAIHLRFSLWREGLPIDALPLEGAMLIPVITEDEMAGEMYNYSVSS